MCGLIYGTLSKVSLFSPWRCPHIFVQVLDYIRWPMRLVRRLKPLVSKKRFDIVISRALRPVHRPFLSHSLVEPRAAATSSTSPEIAAALPPSPPVFSALQRTLMPSSRTPRSSWPKPLPNFLGIRFAPLLLGSLVEGRWVL